MRRRTARTTSSYKQYLDTEPDEVAAVVSAALSGYGEYVRHVARWTAAHFPES